MVPVTARDGCMDRGGGGGGARDVGPDATEAGGLREWRRDESGGL